VQSIGEDSPWMVSEMVNPDAPKYVAVVRKKAAGDGE
jgi:hypothetical protein